MEQLEWAGPVTLNVGPVLIGVRTTSPALTELLCAALDSHLRSEPAAPAYYSLKVGTPSRRRPTPMHYLYVGSRVIFGSRDLKRVVDALVDRLGTHVPVAPTTLVWVRGVAVAAHDKVVLAPPDLLAHPLQVERELLSLGVAIGTHEFVALGSDGFLRLPESGLDVREELLAASRLVPIGAVELEASLPAAPWRLEGWLIESAEGVAGVFDPAQALLHGVREVRLPVPTTAQQALDEVALALATTTVCGVAWQTPEELCELVAAAVVS
jgi:hypothetical protein